MGRFVLGRSVSEICHDALSFGGTANYAPFTVAEGDHAKIID